MSRRDIDYAEKRIRSAYYELFSRYFVWFLVFGVGVCLLGVALMGALVLSIWLGYQH